MSGRRWLSLLVIGLLLFLPVSGAAGYYLYNSIREQRDVKRMDELRAEYRSLYFKEPLTISTEIDPEKRHKEETELEKKAAEHRKLYVPIFAEMKAIRDRNPNCIAIQKP